MGKGVGSLFLVVLSFLLWLPSVVPQRYEFKHSFRPPYYLGRGGSLPFWEFGASTIVLEDYIRLTPASQSRVGWLWNTVPVEMDSWEIHVDLQISGGGKLGADGLALWYVREPKLEGPVMGNKDFFDGIGVIFDSYDNDGQNDNPNILLVVNDGTKSYDAGQDGSSLVVGKCSHIPWRERRSKVKVSYQEGWLQVFMEVPFGDNSWQSCAAHQIHLNKGNYFGVTAATGYLVDNHDVFSWVTYNLDPWKQPVPATEHAQDAQQRLDNLDSANPNPATAPVQPPTESAPQPMQPRQQPVQTHQAVRTPPVMQTPPQMQPVQQPVQRAQPVQQPVQQSSHDGRQSGEGNQDVWAGIKQLQGQMDALQQQQNQIMAVVNQANAEMRSLVAAKQAGAGLQPQIFADAFEKLLAIVSDTKTVMEDDVQLLRNTLLDIKNLLATGGTVGANKDLVALVNDVSKKVARVQTAIEVAKREQAAIVSDLQTNKEVLVSKIEEGSSFGFWTYFLFFQVCFAVAFVLWRKMRDDASKKFD